jgi:hypothetical protein
MSFFEAFSNGLLYDKLNSFIFYRKRHTLKNKTLIFFMGIDTP